MIIVHVAVNDFKPYKELIYILCTLFIQSKKSIDQIENFEFSSYDNGQHYFDQWVPAANGNVLHDMSLHDIII
mgnify:CR=1 FL=1